MANLVLNGKSIDGIDDIAENFVEEDVLREFRSGSLASWLEEYGYEEELERVRAIKPTASSIRVLAGISEALNLDDDVIAEAAARREEQQSKEEAVRKAREEQQKRDEEERLRKEREAEAEFKDKGNQNQDQISHKTVEAPNSNPNHDFMSFFHGTGTMQFNATGQASAVGNQEETSDDADDDGMLDLDDGLDSCDGVMTHSSLNPALFNRVREIIVEQLGVNAEQVTPDASFLDDLGADELDAVELIMAFEEEFGAAIPEEDAKRIDTVGKAVAYLQSRGY